MYLIGTRSVLQQEFTKPPLQQEHTEPNPNPNSNPKPNPNLTYYCMSLPHTVLITMRICNMARYSAGA